MNTELSAKQIYRIERIRAEKATTELLPLKLEIISKIEITQQDQINLIKTKGVEWVDRLLSTDLTATKPGSITYLLYGAKPSEQSINIKFGRYGEVLAKDLIQINTDLQLLQCGIQKINDKNKDIDLIWENKTTKTIFYRELKGNIELDTEKLPATINKCKEIEINIKTRFPEYKVDCGILNWSIYNRQCLSAGLSNIKTFENNGIKIDHMCEFLQSIDIIWPEKDFYDYFNSLGLKIQNHNK
jgi:hypothetical protein